MATEPLEIPPLKRWALITNLDEVEIPDWSDMPKQEQLDRIRKQVTVLMQELSLHIGDTVFDACDEWESTHVDFMMGLNETNWRELYAWKHEFCVAMSKANADDMKALSEKTEELLDAQRSIRNDMLKDLKEFATTWNTNMALIQELSGTVAALQEEISELKQKLK